MWDTLVEISRAEERSTHRDYVKKKYVGGKDRLADRKEAGGYN